MCIRDRCNSLFEDNAEFGYGMLLAQNTIRERMKGHVEKLAENACLLYTSATKGEIAGFYGTEGIHPVF